MTSPIYRTRNRFSPMLILSVIAIAVGSLGTSCSPLRKMKSDPLPKSLNPDHWHKVKANPPTYYPRGIKADHPTTSDEGMWVMSGDAYGTCYFIPVRGCDTRRLCAEAMSTRTREQKRKMSQSDGSGVNAGGIFRGVTDGIGYFLFDFGRDREASTYTHPVSGSERVKR